MTRSAAPNAVLSWARRAEPAVVELACAEHPDPGRGARGADVVRLPGCLAEMGLHLPVEILALGVREVVLRLDGCSHPERSRQWLAPLAALDAAVDSRTIRLADAPTGSRRRPVLEAAHMPLPRRALLLLPDGDGAPLPDPAAASHARLRDALARLVDRPVDDVPGPGLRLAATGCEARGVCARTCPEEALVLATSAGVACLVFDPSRCTGCGACIASCDRNALAATGRHPWSAILDAPTQSLARVPVRTCRRCGVAFATTVAGDALCPVCSHRSAHPFGAALPPGALERLPDHVRDHVRDRLGGRA